MVKFYGFYLSITYVSVPSLHGESTDSDVVMWLWRCNVVAQHLFAVVYMDTINVY